METIIQLAGTALLCMVLSAQAADFSVISPSLKPGGTLPTKHVLQGFGCTGGNTSPALSWQNAPADTQSFAITAYDPDAPTGSGWWHWVAYNIPATVQSVSEGAGAANSQQLPAGATQGKTDFGTVGYGGACPPVGDKAHRYIFTVHALKTPKINLPPDASAAMIGFMIHMNKLASTSLEVTYGR
ncbi:phosphatidylethanolamine-binding protein [Limnohabitans sp. T6-5]|uniref:YbhB/YbcL family Raf kinase inhibitor-like protein n=1 Tax=Limnohabitans sp. T6-5 TaxID=1100724 RepID=UPI000D33D52D|nr:YbhB/YbcL family Raf kinase inhibitor-like protein [Limnohabitans sp. T6-5]PUE11093.1 phosphatidylethanolamine-binding protein [Limnohabitans sp. T6-5]